MLAAVCKFPNLATILFTYMELWHSLIIASLALYIQAQLFLPNSSGGRTDGLLTTRRSNNCHNK